MLPIPYLKQLSRFRYKISDTAKYYPVPRLIQSAALRAIEPLACLRRPLRLIGSEYLVSRCAGALLPNGDRSANLGTASPASPSEISALAVSDPSVDRSSVGSGPGRAAATPCPAIQAPSGCRPTVHRLRRTGKPRYHRLLIVSRQIYRAAECGMAGACERVERDGAAGGR